MIFHIFGDKEIENWPREEFDGRKYYIVTPETIKRFEGKDVKFDIGEKVTISYNPEKLLFFNPLDGNRIDVEGDGNG